MHSLCLPGTFKLSCSSIYVHYVFSLPFIVLISYTDYSTWADPPCSLNILKPLPWLPSSHSLYKGTIIYHRNIFISFIEKINPCISFIWLDDWTNQWPWWGSLLLCLPLPCLPVSCLSLVLLTCMFLFPQMLFFLHCFR